MRKDRRRSIRFHLIAMVASLIAAVCLIVMLTFNVLMSRYMENNATQVLSHSRDFTFTWPAPSDPAHTSSAPTGPSSSSAPPGSVSAPPPGDPRPRETPAGRAEMVVMSYQYEILMTDRFPVRADVSSNASDFATGARLRKADLNSGSIEKLETERSLYYYTAIQDSNKSGFYAVFFISMTDLYTFQRNVGNILSIIMLVALVAGLGVTYRIGSRIAAPVKSLSGFATEIGEGKYDIMKQEFVDLELHQLRDSLNETSRKLKEYDSEQRTFFQNVSHELRTPLQIVKTASEGMAHGVVDKDKASRTIETETDNLSELIEDIIYLSRLESRSTDMSFIEVDLRDTLSSVVERHSALLRDKGISIEFDFQDSPVILKCEERSMERAFQNLLSNAIRYAKDRIKLTCKQVEGRILIAVEDNGPGISKEDLPKIFDRFYKGEKGGHGIGLSIVKSVVTAHGGRIEVSTGPQRSTFTMFFDPPAGM